MAQRVYLSRRRQVVKKSFSKSIVLVLVAAYSKYRFMLTALIFFLSNRQVNLYWRDNGALELTEASRSSKDSFYLRFIGIK